MPLIREVSVGFTFWQIFLRSEEAKTSYITTLTEGVRYSKDVLGKAKSARSFEESKTLNQD